jgi:hypothetical protein
MDETIAAETAPPAFQPLFDAEGTRKVLQALGRAAAASLASGIAISTREPQSVESTLRIQSEIHAAFTSLAYRDPSKPAVTELAQEEPVGKLLSAINRFGAAAVAAGVIGSSGRRHSVGDAMRTYWQVMQTMWPGAPPGEPAGGAPLKGETRAKGETQD